MTIFLASSITQTATQIAQELQAKAKNLSLVFITTASESEAGDLTWLTEDRQALINAGFKLTDYSISGKTYSELKNDLDCFDVIHVNGGNTFYLLLKIQESGFKQWIKEAILAGKTYIGSSAGAIVAAPNIEIAKKLETKIYEDQLRSFDGLNIVDLIILPHWGSEGFQAMYLNQRLLHAYREENKIILLNDFQYLICDSRTFKFVDIRTKQ